MTHTTDDTAGAKAQGWLCVSYLPPYFQACFHSGLCTELCAVAQETRPSLPLALPASLLRVEAAPVVGDPSGDDVRRVVGCG